MELYFSIVEQIEQADLASTVYRTARRLLDMAISTRGHVVLSHERMMALCETDKKATMRSHLVQLSRAEIIHYSTNAAVYITFVVIAERAQVIAQRSNSASERSQTNGDAEQTNPLRALSARNDRSAITDDRSAREMIAERANDDAYTIYPHAGALGIGLVGIHTTPSSEDIPTNPELPELTVHQQRAYALLVDSEIGMNVETARSLCSKHTLLYVARQTATYWSERQAGAVNGAGALVNRLKPGSPFRPAPVSDEFRRSSLADRHQLPQLFAEADASERRSKWDADPYQQRSGGGYTVPAEFQEIVIG